ncbi:sensor histidine kinase [Belnapia moabensis]|uniref:sensor histidine kinase n=1 Tax=Belnapia moabensis TaxID=365533 RepID=UPI000694AD83|nr:sensor histidine kinase [Belnapia moabensis]
MNKPLNPRELELEAEIARLQAELAMMRGEIVATAKAHAEELAISAELNVDLGRANAGLADGERRHALLLAELNHRVKNILATVQGLAAQTLKGTGGDPRRFAQHFGARLKTLARAHDMLTKLGWDAAGIEDTVRNALAPWTEHGRPLQFHIPDGCMKAKVSPRQAQALVLALHELATNATKYGALSTPEGRVSIWCEAGPEGTLAIQWAEAGGPPVVGPPDRRGFGTRLLERGLAHDLGRGSAVELRFKLAGLQAAIQFTPEQIAC